MNTNGVTTQTAEDLIVYQYWRVEWRCTGCKNTARHVNLAKLAVLDDAPTRNMVLGVLTCKKCGARADSLPPIRFMEVELDAATALAWEQSGCEEAPERIVCEHQDQRVVEP